MILEETPYLGELRKMMIVTKVEIDNLALLLLAFWQSHFGAWNKTLNVFTVVLIYFSHDKMLLL